MAHQENTKATTMRSLMANEKLSKALLDGLNAPLGSTKRDKARSIIKSLSRARANYAQAGVDTGAKGGGTGLAIPQQGPKPTVATYAPFSSSGATPAQPAPKPSAPKPAAAAATVDTYAPSFKLMDRGLTPNAVDALGPNSTIPTPPVLDIKGVTDRGTVGQYFERARTAVDMIFNTANAIANQEPYAGAKPSVSGGPTPSAPAGQAQMGKVDDVTPGGYAPAGSPTGLSHAEDINGRLKAAIDKAAAEGRSLTVSEMLQITGGDVPITALGGNIPAEAASDVSAEGLALGASTYGKEWLDSWYNGLDASAKDYYKDMYDWAKTGASTESVQWSIMSDKDKLSKLLNVPVDQLKDFPTNGLVGSHLLALRKTLEDDYDLKGLANEILNRTVEVPMLENNLKSFIRGKDEYDTQLEMMLDEANTAYATMDTSNPNVDRRMKNYVNYLTTLQGRQNQRYIDVVKTSVDMYEADLDRLVALEGKLSKDMEQQLSDAAVLTQDTVDSVKKTISSMYEMVSGIEDRAVNSQKAKLDLLNSQEELLGRQLANKKAQWQVEHPNEEFGKSSVTAGSSATGTAATSSGLTSSALNPKKAAGALSSLKTSLNITRDSKTKEESANDFVDPAVLAQLIETYNYPVDLSVSTYVDNTAKYVESMIENPATAAAGDAKRKEMMSSLKATYDANEQAAASGDAGAMIAYSAAGMLYNKLLAMEQDAARSSAASDPKMVEGARSLFKDLARSGWFSGDAYTSADREEFMDKNANNPLGPEKLAKVWDNYIALVREKLAQYSGKLDEAGAAKLATAEIVGSDVDPATQKVRSYIYDTLDDAELVSRMLTMSEASI